MEQFYYEYRREHKNIELKQYIYRIGSYHYNWHSDLELLLVLNGEVEMCTRGASHILGKDDLILINSNCGHATLARQPDSIAMVLHINPVFLKEYYEDAEFISFNVCSDAHTRYSEPFCEIRRQMSQMVLSSGKVAPETRLLFEMSLYHLIYTIVSCFPPEKIKRAAFNMNRKKLHAIDDMIRYINKNFCRKITLDTLAKASGYNSSYVSQLFRSYMGITFYDYLTRVRLREATRDLSQSDKKIVDIALEHGFSDLKAFNIAFGKTFQKSPTEYRKQLDMESCKYDLTFKKEFVAVDDALVNSRISEYCSIQRQEKESESSLPDELKEIGSRTREMSDILRSAYLELSGITDRVEAALKKY